MIRPDKALPNLITNSKSPDTSIRCQDLRNKVSCSSHETWKRAVACNVTMINLAKSELNQLSITVYYTPNTWSLFMQIQTNSLLLNCFFYWFLSLSWSLFFHLYGSDLLRCTLSALSQHSLRALSVPVFPSTLYVSMSTLCQHYLILSYII